MIRPLPPIPDAAFWTDSTFTDMLGVCGGSERVNRRVLTGGAVVLEILPNYEARAVATLLLARHLVARMEAYGTRDYTYAVQPSPHFAYQDAARIGNSNVGALLDALAFNVANPNAIKRNLEIRGGGGNAGLYASWGLSGVPPYSTGTSADRDPTLVTPVAPIADAARLVTIVAAQNALDATVDAGLAATCAANLTAARAAYLAQIQGFWPSRGYT